MKQIPDRSFFYKEVYSVVQSIPPCHVITYGQIAEWIGWPQHSRMVGKALSQIPESLHLPCHRVVNSQGRLVPRWPEQRKLLEEEGVSFTKGGCVRMRMHQWILPEED